MPLSAEITVVPFSAIAIHLPDPYASPTHVVALPPVATVVQDPFATCVESSPVVIVFL